MPVSSIAKFVTRWKVVSLAAAVVVVLLLGSLWVLFPWPDRVYGHQYPNGTSVRIEVTRRYRLLPQGEWGFSANRLIFDGLNTCGRCEEIRLGFLEMTDMKVETFLPPAD
jgi:hypothetical protein